MQGLQRLQGHMDDSGLSLELDRLQLSISHKDESCVLNKLNPGFYGLHRKKAA